MFCRFCGTQIEDGLAFCTNCGSKQETKPQFGGVPVSPVQPTPQPFVAPKKVTFGEAIGLYFKNYANFTGRTTKGEYWWAFLFVFLVNMVTCWIPVVGGIVMLAFLVPNLSMAVRRLHDTGKSWVYILMGLIPFAGLIILLVQYCKDSDGDNKWGTVSSGVQNN